jgi:hypothetical protein
MARDDRKLVMIDKELVKQLRANHREMIEAARRVDTAELLAPGEVSNQAIKSSLAAIWMSLGAHNAVLDTLLTELAEGGSDVRG